MDSKLFLNDAPGELVSITIPQTGEQDKAFVPDALPDDWALPVELWPLLAEARQWLGTLDGIGRTLPNPELLLQPLQQREALRSSSLEGTYATPEQLLLFELGSASKQKAGESVQPWVEVSNYGTALREGYNYLREYPISTALFRLLHNYLMTGVRGEDKNPGQFRETQVYIGVGRRFVPPPPLQLPGLLERLEALLFEPPGQIDPLVFSYMVHYQFETIHPFTDGNGRVGRLLLALTTWKWSQMTMPWLYMSPFFEQHKDDYIDLLFGVSSRGDWKSWMEFCLVGTIEQSKDSIRRCEELGKLRDQMHQRVASPSPRSHSLIERLFVAPVVTVPWVRDQYDITYPTAKSDIDRLISAGILAEVEGTTHPAIYIAPEILRIAYS